MSPSYRNSSVARVPELDTTVPNVAGSKRRGYGEDSIYFDHASGCEDRLHRRGCPGRWRGSISLSFGLGGKRVRRK